MNRSLFVLVVVAGCGPAADDSLPPAADPSDPTGGTVVDPTVEDPTVSSPTTPPVVCVPPALLELSDIPDAPLLERVSPDVLAAFEVDGDELVGKVVRDEDAARGALVLWQELVLRIPVNQRAQLVQFTLYGGSSDNVGWTDNTGTNNQTGRYGPSVYFHETYLEDDRDVCAPLSGHRGTYDWTLIHEFAHLRTYADGTNDVFTTRFPSVTGDGEGYPEDGSPSLDGEFVTSYAERAGGDEDTAESFTTWVMLETLPTETSGAADKVRFLAERPDYAALRLALRITEPGGGGPVADAPLATYDLEIDNPPWLWGTWEGQGPDGPIGYDVTEHDLVFRETVDGVTEEVDYAHLRDDGTLATIEVYESSEKFHLHQVAIGAAGFSESFRLAGDGVIVEREGLGTVSLTRLAP